MASASNCSWPLSGTLFAFETNSQGMPIEEMPPIMVAAIDASNRFHGRRSKPDQWKEEFSLACRTQISTMSLFVSQIRVLKQVTFIQLESHCLSLNLVGGENRAEEFRNHRCFIVSKCGEHKILATLADILEEAVIPFIAASANAVDTNSAWKLLLAVKDVGHPHFSRYYGNAEAVPMTKAFENCTAEEIEQYRRSISTMYFDERGANGELTRKSVDRIRYATRLLVNFFLSKLIGNQMLGTEDVPDHIAEELPRAALCMAPSTTGTAGFSFFYEKLFFEEAYEGKRTEYIHTLLGAKRPIGKMFKKLMTAMKDFSKMLVFTNLTNDIRNGTNNAHELLSNSLLQ